MAPALLVQRQARLPTFDWETRTQAADMADQSVQRSLEGGAEGLGNDSEDLQNYDLAD